VSILVILEVRGSVEGKVDRRTLLHSLAEDLLPLLIFVVRTLDQHIRSVLRHGAPLLFTEQFTLSAFIVEVILVIVLGVTLLHPGGMTGSLDPSDFGIFQHLLHLLT
jgi:hypothetical protein